MVNTTQFSEPLKIKLKLKVGITLYVKLHLHTTANFSPFLFFNLGSCHLLFVASYQPQLVFFSCLDPHRTVSRECCGIHNQQSQKFCQAIGGESFWRIL